MRVIPHVHKQEHTKYPFFGEMMTCHWIYNANCCSNSTTTELLIQQVSYTFPMTGKAALLTTNFQSRTAVLLQEDNIPQATWKLGITKINQGSGRLVKMVTAHTRQGTFKHTVYKLCHPPKDHIHYSIELL
jgi:hypothetical protein